jgi:ferredoxin/voltage-gated potassium channel Kch
VVVVGSGPTGLAAAFTLARAGHSCTVVDRNSSAGGSLRPAKELAESVLNADIARLQALGIEFKFEMALGAALTIDGLLRGFDAVLLATGELTKEEPGNIGVATAGNGIKINDVFQTSVAEVFSAGSAVKPVKHLVRAMADGVTAAECIHQFLTAGKIMRAGKPFSSIMGRLEKTELDLFLKQGSSSLRLAPSNVSNGFSNEEASVEAARCVHCDCRAAGDCRLQAYAAIYGADQSRFREGRRLFEQHRQHTEVIYEPGKCIRCGICVRITEMAREPLGLTFIGRGFDVQVAAPMDETIAEGLKKTAKECVEGCPTGALVQSK